MGVVSGMANSSEPSIFQEIFMFVSGWVKQTFTYFIIEDLFLKPNTSIPNQGLIPKEPPQVLKKKNAFFSESIVLGGHRRIFGKGATDKGHEIGQVGNSRNHQLFWTPLGWNNVDPKHIWCNNVDADLPRQQALDKTHRPPMNKARWKDIPTSLCMGSPLDQGPVYTCGSCTHPRLKQTWAWPFHCTQAHLHNRYCWHGRHWTRTANFHSRSALLSEISSAPDVPDKFWYPRCWHKVQESTRCTKCLPSQFHKRISVWNILKLFRCPKPKISQVLTDKIWNWAFDLT